MKRKRGSLISLQVWWIVFLNLDIFQLCVRDILLFNFLPNRFKVKLRFWLPYGHNCLLLNNRYFKAMLWPQNSKVSEMFVVNFEILTSENYFYSLRQIACLNEICGIFRITIAFWVVLTTLWKYRRIKTTILLLALTDMQRNWYQMYYKSKFTVIHTDNTDDLKIYDLSMYVCVSSQWRLRTQMKNDWCNSHG